VSDELLKKTLDLFEPFQPDEDSDEGKDNDVRETEARSAEEPPTETIKPKPKKPRRYEREHPAFRFRIRPEDKARIEECAHELGVSLDAVAAALINASLDALDDEHLSITMEKEVLPWKDSIGRSRQRIVTNYSWQWSCEAHRGKND
jgi:hypothetical protein